APCCREARLVCALRRLRGIALLRVRGVDRGAVLGADVVSLPHALRRIVRLPERPEQILVVDLLRVVDHAHDFCVPGLAAADLLVSRMGSEATRVAHRGRVHARKLPEDPFCTPEAAQTENRLAHAGRERRDNAMTVHEMRLRY